MLNHQNFNNIKEALTVKSTLQEINERVYLKSQGVVEQNPTHTYKLKNFETITLNYVPTIGSIIRLPVPVAGNHFALVKSSSANQEKIEIHPAPPSELKDMIKQGYTIDKRDQEAFTNYQNSLRYRLKLPIFFEYAERIIYNVFARFFTRNSATYSKDTYISELILIIILAVIAMLSVWIIAALLSS